jgi:cell wall-associated NlpC family hydrolase
LVKKMTRTRSLLVVGAALVVSLPVPTSTSAQGTMVLEGYAARKQQPMDLTFGGLGFTGYTGIFGLRVSGGLNLGRGGATEQTATYQWTQCPTGPCQVKTMSSNYRESSGLHVGGWTADADVLLEPFRRVPVVKSLLLGFSPYGFFGIGGYGIRPQGATDTSRSTLSYGLGAHHDMLGWLGVGVEARYRRPIGSDSAVTVGTPKSWEYRLGLTASFGGGNPWRHRATPVRSEPPRPAVVERIYVQPQTTTRYIIEPSGTTKLASRILSTADEYVGTKYRSGGTSPRNGFDGAGFVQWVFWREGIRLPRTARRMANLGEPVSTRYGALRPGDLLFFANDGDRVNHVAIYVGGDRIVHATSTGNGVRYDVLGEGDRGRWFAGHLVSARRITTNERFYDSYYDDDPAPPDRAPRPYRW